MLVELGLVEQRYRAVCEVLEGATVTDVARRNGVVRQTVHDWLRRYARDGRGGLVDCSSKPQSCPHQMAPEVEVRILELRRTPRRVGRGRAAATARRPERLVGRSAVVAGLDRVMARQPGADAAAPLDTFPALFGPPRGALRGRSSADHLFSLSRDLRRARRAPATVYSAPCLVQPCR